MNYTVGKFKSGNYNETSEALEKNAMKKVLLFAFVLILTACSAQAPQVTVTFAQRVTVTLPPPTATIIPTPTLHPEVLALQQQVAANGTKYSLGSDGILKDETGEQVKGIEINPATGEITIMVNDAEVTIEADKVSISDGGITIEGYAFDVVTGNSVIDLASSEAAQPTMTLLNELGVTVGADGIVDLQMDGDTVVIIEKSTGEDVGRDGLLTLDFMHEVLSRSGLVGGLQAPANPRSSRINQPKDGGSVDSYALDLKKQFNLEFINQFGVDTIGVTKRDANYEILLVRDDFWIEAIGTKQNGIAVYEYVTFRPRNNDEAIKIYQILPYEGKVDKIWSDDPNPA